MDTTTITPRFSETDILGHISNTALPVWFETARDGFFRRVHPTMTTHDWPLILARIELDLKAQIHLGNDVTIKTGLEKIGNSSVVVYQQAWQNDVLAACAKTVMVYFDYQEQRSRPLPNEVRERLAEMLIEPS